VARWAGGLALLCVWLSFLPGCMRADRMRWGYGSSMLAWFGVMCCAPTWLVYRRRARMLDRMLRGDGVIARWAIEPGLWSSASAEECREDRAEKRGLFWIVACFALFWGVVLMMYDHDAGRWVLLSMVLLLALLAPLAFLLPAWRHRRRMRRGGTVVISRGGAYVGGELHDWGMAGCALEDVEISGAEGARMLVIEYSSPSRVAGREITMVRIPVPSSERSRAEKVGRVLASVGKLVAG
jgi:hypothetical protein